MSQLGRRTFLAAAGAAVAARGANDRINVAVVGLRGRGRDHISEYAAQRNCRIAAICDIDDAQTERAQALLRSLGREEARAYRDFRKLLEDKELDAVSIASPNHWHALQTIWACQAGKDVYVEKPASHCVWEGRKMVEAARKYKRMVQVGMQSRSIIHKRRAIELLRQGVIGDVYMARGICFKRRPAIGTAADGAPPLGADYDLWLGPASSRPFNEKRFHYNWHWFWDTGNGDIGNQGVHEMDIARWGLGKDHLPEIVHSTGGLFGRDDQETPNTQLAEFHYGNCLLTFEVRGELTGGEGSIQFDGGNFIGNLFFGSQGWMSVDVGGYQIYRGDQRELVEQSGYQEPREWDTAPHIQNFLEAVHSRNHKDLNADVLEGHLSAALCHLANISYRTGRKLRFDAAVERFVNDPEADALLRPSYRPPFVVPEEV